MVIGLVAVTAVALAATLLADRGDSEWGRIAKMVASTGFVGVAIASSAFDSRYGRIVLIALGLSWLGDLLLSFPAPTAFLGGLVAFLTAHLGYFGAFVVRGVDWSAAAAVAAIAILTALLVWRWLRPHLEAAMRFPVAAYVVVISAMVAVASGTAVHDPGRGIAVGAIAFYLSDLAVARDRFVKPGFGNRAWGLPLYYLAQVLLAASTAMV
jgi:uncharacterized membrane protein YhhN